MTVQETSIDADKAITIDSISAENAPAIFGHNSLDQFVAMARASVIGEVPDLTTAAGRKRIASLAATVARSKTALDGKGRDYLRELKAKPKVIEAELRKFGEDMDALRDEVRKPLNDWEAKKEAEEAAVQSAIDQVVNNFTLPADANADEIQGALFGLEQEPLTVEMFGERLEEAEAKRTYGITVLTEQLAKRQQYEREQAELVENRRKIAALEEEKRIKDAADLAVANERARVEQEQQQKRDDDARRVRDAEQATRQAEQDRIAAEQRLEDERRQSEQRQQNAVRLERERLEQEQAERERLQREQEEQQRRDDEARAANRVHQGKINKAALDAILAINMAPEGQPEAFLKPEVAKNIVAAIIRGQIPAVTITY
jgi:hypothetical protein